MRILTAGFDHARSEQLGQRLTDAGHLVMSASGVSSCRTLASSVVPDVMLVPEGVVGDDAQGWAADLLGETAVLRLSADTDPVEALDEVRGPRGDAGRATEQLNEAVIVAAMETSPEEGTRGATADRRASAATEHLSEPALLAAMEGDQRQLAALPNPPAPSVTAAALETPRRAVTLRSTHTGPTLTDKLHDIRFGDYHAILELQPGASAYVVRQQYDLLKHLYTPSGWHAPVGPAELDSLTEIGQALDDALSILGHPTYQSRYEMALDAGVSSRA
jgi:hypothetical protein